LIKHQFFLRTILFIYQQEMKFQTTVSLTYVMETQMRESVRLLFKIKIFLNKTTDS